MFPSWDGNMIAVSASFHSVAILSTLFRFWYRWHIARLWWDDGWAGVAFLADITCLIATVIEKPIPGAAIPRSFTAGNWIVSVAYPTLMWAARISILAAIVRVTRPEGILRHTALSTGILFGLMGVSALAVRLWNCVTNACLMTKLVLISQTAVDCIADVLLSGLPIWFLRSVKMNHQRKILVCSALSASMVINIVTVLQAIIFFQSITSGSIIFAHVKVACSLIVCNMLVITTFVYRIMHGNDAAMEDSVPENRIEFTTIDLGQVDLSQDTSKELASSAPSGTTKSSTWSFHGVRSNFSRSMTTTASRVGVGTEDRSVNVQT